MKKENPFKPNTSRVDVLENRIEILMERVAKLERDLTYLYKHMRQLEEGSISS